MVCLARRSCRRLILGGQQVCVAPSPWVMLVVGEILAAEEPERYGAGK